MPLLAAGLLLLGGCAAAPAASPTPVVPASTAPATAVTPAPLNTSQACDVADQFMAIYTHPSKDLTGWRGSFAPLLAAGTALDEVPRQQRVTAAFVTPSDVPDEALSVECVGATEITAWAVVVSATTTGWRVASATPIDPIQAFQRPGE